MRAHLHIHDQTEMALDAVEDLARKEDATKPLSLTRLRGILKKYGPVVNVNQRSEDGDTFLVSCCLAEGVTEAVILACVKELIEKYNADPNVEAFYDCSGKLIMGCLLAAVCRGFPTIVKYLLENTTVATDKLYTARIGLLRAYPHPPKYIEGTFSALEFAEKLNEDDMECGATQEELRITFREMYQTSQKRY